MSSWVRIFEIALIMMMFNNGIEALIPGPCVFKIFCDLRLIYVNGGLDCSKTFRETVNILNRSPSKRVIINAVSGWNSGNPNLTEKIYGMCYNKELRVDVVPIIWCNNEVNDNRRFDVIIGSIVKHGGGSAVFKTFSHGGVYCESSVKRGIIKYQIPVIDSNVTKILDDSMRILNLRRDQ